MDAEAVVMVPLSTRITLGDSARVDRTARNEKRTRGAVARMLIAEALDARDRQFGASLLTASKRSKRHDDL